MTWEEVFAELEVRAARGIDIVPYPHPALRHKTVSVQVFGDDLRKLVGLMFEKMYERKGCGLAAPQLGLPFRLFVINPTGDPARKDKEVAFVNPIITPKIQRGRTRTCRDTEGCLSISGLNRAVDRPHDVDYEAFTPDGKKFAGTYGGLNSRVVQHEYDHLEGILFTDILDETQKPGVAEWLGYLTTQFNCVLNFTTTHFPPVEEMKKRLSELEKLVAKPSNEIKESERANPEEGRQEVVVPAETCHA